MAKRLLLCLVASAIALCALGQGLTPAYGVVRFDTCEPSSTGSHAGDITVPTDFGVAGEFAMIVSPSTTATPNRIWTNQSDGVRQLRVYGGTITFRAAEGKKLTRIEFKTGSAFADPAFSCGSFDPAAKVWTAGSGAETTEVVATASGQMQMSKVTVGEAAEPAGPTEAADIAAFKRGEQGAPQRLALSGATVTFISGDDYFVEEPRAPSASTARTSGACWRWAPSCAARCWAPTRATRACRA